MQTVQFSQLSQEGTWGCAVFVDEAWVVERWTP